MLADKLEVGAVEVHEGVLEGSDQHGTILKQFLIQNYTCKMDKKLIFVFRYLLHAERSLSLGLSRKPLRKPFGSKFYQDLRTDPIEIKGGGAIMMFA